MKINFGQVPAEDVDTFGDEDLYGPDENGNFYYNTVEYGTNPGALEEVAIHDGCGRYMPISVDHIPDLIQALEHLYDIHQAIVKSETILKTALSDETAYVEYSQVCYESESVQDSPGWY